MENTVFLWRHKNGPFKKKKGYRLHQVVGDGFGGRDAGRIIKAVTHGGPALCRLLSRPVPQPISFLPRTTISKGDSILPILQRRKPRLSQIQQLCQGHRAKEAIEAGSEPNLTLQTY